MCLIVFSYREHARFPFIFAGNRDEFHARPASPARFWDAYPHLLAGRDLQAGGTWLGVTLDGRFATVTNYREPARHVPEARSRGELVTDFLVEAEEPESYLAPLRMQAHRYGGFNLILGTVEALYYYSNRGMSMDGVERETGAPESESGSHPRGRPPEDEPVAIRPGLHGLSNERLDTPWPKVRRAKALFRDIVDKGDPTPESLLELLSDTVQPPDRDLPSGDGLDAAWERALSSIFISGEVYGTRASTVVLLRRDGKLTFTERTYGAGGLAGSTETFAYTIGSPDL